jgi:hypothetical protein
LRIREPFTFIPHTTRRTPCMVAKPEPKFEFVQTTHMGMPVWMRQYPDGSGDILYEDNPGMREYEEAKLADNARKAQEGRERAKARRAADPALQAEYEARRREATRKRQETLRRKRETRVAQSQQLVG